jgi:hypothetical protein
MTLSSQLTKARSKPAFELRLAAQEGLRQAVHPLGLDRHVAARVDIDVEAAPGRDEVLDLEAGEFDQAVTEMGLEAGGFGVEYDLTRHDLVFARFVRVDQAVVLSRVGLRCGSRIISTISAT